MANDAFSQGKLAFEHNHPMSSCDYPVGSSLRAEWMAGWTEANNARPTQRPAGAPTSAAKPDDQRLHRI